jgi:hypothetical protein
MIKITIIKENTEKNHIWYNSIKASQGWAIRGNGKKEIIKNRALKSKVGNTYDVMDFDSKNYITSEEVFGNMRMLIRKEDCLVVN